MTPEEEQEKYIYLKLKQKEATGIKSQASDNVQSSIGRAVSDVVSPITTAAKALQPKNLTGLLPVGGMMAGSVLGPAGMAGGAGLGSIAQRMADLAYGASPEQPVKSIMGMPLSPRVGEAVWPMANAALAGLPETSVGQAMGQKGKEVLSSIKDRYRKPLAQIGQALTGKSAVKVGRIMEDPTAILPESLGGAKSVENASKAYGDALAKDASLIPHEGGQQGGYFTRGLTKKEFSPFPRGGKEAEETAQSIWDKWQLGEPIDAQEAFDAKRATDKLWPAVVKERNQEQIRQLSEFKTAMDDILSTQAEGPFQKASKDYARARLGADFTQILPRTKTGDISTVKTLLLHTLAPGRGVGMLAGGLTSPLTTGVGNLAGQAAFKGLNTIGGNPEARQILLQILQQIQQGKKQ